MKIVAKDRAGELRPFFAMGEDFLDELDQELEDSATQIKGIAEFTAPYKTGRLQDNHEMQKIKRFVYKVFNITPYASYVHDGTRFMDPRPWLKNAHDEVVDGLISRLMMRFKFGGGRKLTIEEAEKELFG